MEVNRLNCQLFKGLGPNEIDKILRTIKADRKSYKKGSYIFMDGDHPKYMYILLDGKLVIEKTDIKGRSTIMNTFNQRGTIFAEVFIFLDGKNLEYSARVIEDTEVIRIPRDFLDRLYDYDCFYKKISSNMLEILSSKAYHLNNKIAIFSSYSLRQKIANYIDQNISGSFELDLELNREQLAEYIGTTRPSLSRELGNMERDGLIRLKTNKIEILDPQALKDLL